MHIFFSRLGTRYRKSENYRRQKAAGIIESCTIGIDRRYYLSYKCYSTNGTYVSSNAKASILKMGDSETAHQYYYGGISEIPTGIRAIFTPQEFFIN